VLCLMLRVFCGTEKSSVSVYICVPPAHQCLCVRMRVSPAHLWLGEHCCLLPTTLLYRVKALCRIFTTERAWALDSMSATHVRATPDSNNPTL
jgi:hypothetical protein